MRILVTGANGFIGRQIVGALADRNHFVFAMSKGPFCLDNKHKGRVLPLQADITDKNSLVAIENDIDAVFHLAGWVHKSEDSDLDKQRFFDVNVTGTKNILGALRNTPKHFVFFSTVSVYGIKDAVLNEESAVNPSSAYASSKLEAEKIIRDWGQERNTKVTCLRLASVYGEGNKGNLDKMFWTIRNNLFFMVGNGDARRSLVNIKNVIDASMAVLEKQQKEFEVYNITDGVDYSIREIYELTCKFMNKKPACIRVPVYLAKVLSFSGELLSRITFVRMPFRVEDFRRLTTSALFSSEKIKHELGFIPRYNLYNSLDYLLRGDK